MPVGPRPAPPVGSARVAMSGQISGHRYVSVFYLELTGTGITVNDLKDIADFVAATWNTDYAPQVSGANVLQQVDVRFINAVGSEVRYTGTYSNSGTNAGGTIQDAGACAVIDFVISDFYRGGHPRQYIPGVPANKVTNGSDIDATYAAALVTAVNAFRNSLNAHTTTNVSAMVMGTVRFASHNAWLTPPRFVAFTSVKAGNLLKLGSQRRRIKS